MELYSSRLILREIVLDDATALLDYGLAAENRRYEPFSPPDALRFQEMVKWMISEQRPYPRTYYYLAIALKTLPTLAIGSIHLTIRSHSHCEGEIGYLMGVAYQRQGYATEAAKAVLAFGFETLALRRIIADDIISDNIASIRVAEHVGMRQAAYYPESQYFSGRWWDTLTYDIHYDEWCQQRSRLKQPLNNA